MASIGSRLKACPHHLNLWLSLLESQSYNVVESITNIVDQKIERNCIYCWSSSQSFNANTKEKLNYCQYFRYKDLYVEAAKLLMLPTMLLSEPCIIAFEYAL